MLDERATVVGINFGNSYASIAIITKEGKAECIANEDGERQIAAAISFHGEELYIGNQASPQLVKNSGNTITGFRDLLAKKFSELSPALSDALAPSAPLIQHPTLSDTPAYAVQVLVPAPSPLLTPSHSTRPSTQNTPLATPRSEPTPQTRYLTPYDATTLFLSSLYKSATDFIGSIPSAAVITVPSWFSDDQRTSLIAAAMEAGIQGVHLITEETAAAAALLDASPRDRTTLLVDWGSTNLTTSLFTIRSGLTHVLASRRAPELGTAAPSSIDSLLIQYFAKEFTKKTSESLTVCPPTPSSARAQARLFLSLPHVKRSLTITTAQKSSQISIESLHLGNDFTAPLNRTRASLIFRPVLDKFTGVVDSVLSDAGIDRVWVDSVVWVGGGGRIGALFGVEGLEPEEIGETEEVCARGAALHAKLLLELDADVSSAAIQAGALDVQATLKAVALVFPSIPVTNTNGHIAQNGDAEPIPCVEDIIPLIPADTPLPARRTVVIPITFPHTATSSLPLEIWECTPIVETHTIPPVPLSDDEEDEEEQEPEVEKERGWSRDICLGSREITLKGKAKKITLEVKVDITVEGNLSVRAREQGAEWVGIVGA